MAEKDKQILETVCDAVTKLAPEGKDQLLAYSEGVLAGIKAKAKEKEEDK